MPVKVRCKNCQKVLNAPDKARGKAIKCPQCENRVRVPSANRKKKPAAKGPAEDEDFLSNLDLSEVEDKSVRLCPKCGTEADAEAVECANCGVDLATGLLTEKAKKLRARRGPDPAKFYREAWTDSWQFLRRNLNLVWRTGLYWTLFTLLGAACYYMAFFYCERLPPRVFWAGCWILSCLGFGGWFWFLTTEIIRNTLEKKKTMKRVKFDFFECLALGVKWYAWPVVMMMPAYFLLIPVLLMMGFMAAVSGGGAVFGFGSAIVMGGMLLFPYLVFPIAMTHMSMPYTYKAWIFWEMLKIWGKNLAPALYWLLLAFAVMLPVVLLAGGAITAVIALAGESILNGINSASLWLLGWIETSPDPEGFLYGTFRAVLVGLTGMVLITPVTVAIAFPAVFAMRANGLLAYYNRETLDLVRMQGTGVPAGFWPRFLAGIIDLPLFPLASLLVVKNRQAMIVAWVINAAVILTAYFVSVAAAGLFSGPIWALYNAWLYNVIQEASHTEGTIGKQALGIVVHDKEGRRLTIPHATKRFFAKLLSAIPLGAGFIMAGFTQQKQALHDRMANTHVVWRGEVD